MTTFTSSSAKAAFALVALALTACDQAGSAPAQQPTRTASATPNPAKAPHRASPADLYTADMARAVAGEKKAPFTSDASFGGMACSPAALDGKAPASRALTLTLPASAEARAHVLAVVTPERGLLEIYSPLTDGADAEDIIVPSQTISWAKAKTQDRFATNTDALDGLRLGADAPEALFIERGRYRFALVNGIDGGLLKANGRRVKVTAACSFSWTP